MYNEAPLVGLFLSRFYLHVQSLQTLSQGWCKLNFFVFGILVHWKKTFRCISLLSPVCKMKRPLVRPIFGGFYCYAQTLQTMSQGCCVSNIKSIWTASSWEEDFYKIHQILPIFAWLDPNRCQPFANLNLHFLKMLPTKFGFGEEVV